MSIFFTPQKYDGTQRLYLCRGTHPLLEGQVGAKRIDLAFRHFFRISHAMEPDEPFEPMVIGLFRSPAIVAGAQSFPQLVDNFGVGGRGRFPIIQRFYRTKRRIDFDRLSGKHLQQVVKNPIGVGNGPVFFLGMPSTPFDSFDLVNPLLRVWEIDKESALVARAILNGGGRQARPIVLAHHFFLMS